MSALADNIMGEQIKQFKNGYLISEAEYSIARGLHFFLPWRKVNNCLRNAVTKLSEKETGYSLRNTP